MAALCHDARAHLVPGASGATGNFRFLCSLLFAKTKKALLFWAEGGGIRGILRCCRKDLFAMLKKIAIPILALCLAGVCIFQRWYLSSTFSDLEGIVQDLGAQTEAENWEDALLSYQKLMQHWEHSLPTLSCFLVHDEVDHVCEELQNIGAQLLQRNQVLLPSSIARLGYYLEQIRNEEAFLAENIF